MVTKISRNSDDYVAVLDRLIVEHLGLSDDSSIEVLARDGMLVLRKSTGDVLPDDFEERLERINREWGPTFKKLAE
ncbi:MAG: hypothetical protein AAF711_16315 [Planctomycetota bacterium]